MKDYIRPKGRRGKRVKGYKSDAPDGYKGKAPAGYKSDSPDGYKGRNMFKKTKK